MVSHHRCPLLFLLIDHRNAHVRVKDVVPRSISSSLRLPILLLPFYRECLLDISCRTFFGPVGVKARQFLVQMFSALPFSALSRGVPPSAGAASGKKPQHIHLTELKGLIPLFFLIPPSSLLPLPLNDSFCGLGFFGGCLCGVTFCFNKTIFLPPLSPPRPGSTLLLLLAQKSGNHVIFIV